MSLIGEAFVRIRPDDTGFRSEATRQVKRDLTGVQGAVAGSNREISRFSRGALVGTGALGGLGRAAAFASSAFIGGAGLVYALKTTVAAAEQQQAVQAQLVNALKQQNIALQGNVAEIDRRSLALANMSGYDDELIKTTFVNFVRRTGDVTKALKLNEIAVNVARGRNISLETSAALVTRASLGMAGALRRVGIAAQNGASATELLDLLQRKYAGSAEAYGKTAVGAQERFKVALQNTEEVLGAAVLPSLTILLNKTTKWLNNADNQKSIQNAANDTAAAFGGIASAVQVVIDGFNKLHHADPFGGKSGLDYLKEARDWAHQFGGYLGYSADQGQRLVTVGEQIAMVFGQMVGLGPGFLSGAFTQKSLSLGIPHGVKGHGFVGRPLTAAEQLAIALAGNPDDVQALQAKRAQYQRGLDYAKAQVAAQVGNTAQWAKDIEGLAGDIEQINSHLAQIASDKAAKAEAARLAAIEKLIPNQVRGQGIAAGAFGRFQALVAATIPGRVRGHGVADISAVAGQTAAEQAAALRTQIAEQQVTNEKKLIPFLQTEANLAQEHLRLLKKVGASTVDQLTETLHIAELRRRIRDIRKQSSAQDAFSIQDLFGEAGNQFAAYGSNVAPLNQPLSRQESGGAAVRAAQAGGKSITVVQNFIGARDAGQAIQEASNAARALRY